MPYVLRVISTAFSIVWCLTAPLDHPLPVCSSSRNGTLNMFRFIWPRTKRRMEICFRKVGFTKVFTLFYAGTHTHSRAHARTHTHKHTHTHTCAKSSAWHECFIYRSFRGACCLRFHGLRIPTIKQSTRSHSQGNFNRQEHVCESLKSRTNITESFVCSWSAEQRYIKGTLYTAKHNCIISKRLKYSERSCYTLGFAISVGWELRHGAI